MNNWDQIFNGIQICLSIQLIIISILNFLDKKRKNTFLGIFCLLLIQIPILYIFKNEISNNAFLYAVFGSWKGYFYGPILYLYLRSLHSGEYKTHLFLHLITPSFLCCLSLVGHFFFDSKTAISTSEHQRNAIGLFIKNVGYISYWLLILFYFLKGIKVYKSHIKLNLKAKPKTRFFSFYMLTNIYLLTTTIPGFILFLSFNTDLEIVQTINTQIILPYYNYIAMPQYMLLFAFLIFYGSTESRHLKNIFLAQAIHIKDLGSNSIAIEDVFKEYFESNQIYKNPSLTIDEFSMITRLTKPLIRSFIISNKYKSFTDYLNNYRVENFKQNVAEKKYEKFDLASIAYLSGFNSKASFYRVFKKHTGITPSQYKTSLKDEIIE